MSYRFLERSQEYIANIDPYELAEINPGPAIGAGSDRVTFPTGMQVGGPLGSVYVGCKRSLDVGVSFSDLIGDLRQMAFLSEESDVLDAALPAFLGVISIGDANNIEAFILEDASENNKFEVLDSRVPKTHESELQRLASQLDERLALTTVSEIGFSVSGVTRILDVTPPIFWGSKKFGDINTKTYDDALAGRFTVTIPSLSPMASWLKKDIELR